MPERERQAGLRVEVDEQHLARPARTSATPSEATVVVLPTPPFWLATATVRAIPLPSSPAGAARWRPSSVVRSLPSVSTPPFVDLPDSVRRVTLTDLARRPRRRAGATPSGTAPRHRPAGPRVHRVEGGLHRGARAAGRPGLDRRGVRPARPVRVGRARTTRRRTRWPRSPATCSRWSTASARAGARGRATPSAAWSRARRCSPRAAGRSPRSRCSAAGPATLPPRHHDGLGALHAALPHVPLAIDLRRQGVGRPRGRLGAALAPTSRRSCGAASSPTTRTALRAKAGILLDTPDRTDELAALARDGLAGRGRLRPGDDAWTTEEQDASPRSSGRASSSWSAPATPPPSTTRTAPPPRSTTCSRPSPDAEPPGTTS